MKTLNRKLPFATVFGDTEGRAFEQGDTFFRVDGTEHGVEQEATEVEVKTPEAPAQPPEPEAPADAAPADTAAPADQPAA